MHFEAKKFLDHIMNIFRSEYDVSDHEAKFITILDCGSGDINGNNKHYFTDPNEIYIGVDIAKNPNVNIVSKIHDLNFNEFFDVIISSECFEHDMYYRQSILNIMKMLKPGGLFVFTCAGLGRPEHGTYRTTPQDSFTTSINDLEWGNYYMNLMANDFYAIEGFKEMFKLHKFYYNNISKDLYFYGYKDMDEDDIVLKNFVFDIDKSTHYFIPYYSNGVSEIN